MKLKKLLNKIYSGTYVCIDYEDDLMPEYSGKLGNMTVEKFNNLAERKVYSVSTSADGGVNITLETSELERV